MITLYQFPPAWSLRNLSPFCMKVENYLRLADIAYETKIGDPRKAPKKKLPIIKDGERIIADSQLIIEHLAAKGPDLDAHLTAQEKALGHVVRRMLEEGTYFCNVYFNWLRDDGFTYIERDLLRPQLPPVVGGLIASAIRGSVRKAVQNQGTGRHEEERIVQFAKADMDAIEVILGDKPYLLGDQPSSFDATLYAFLSIATDVPFDTPLKPHLAKKPTFLAYCARMKAKLYPETVASTS